MIGVNVDTTKRGLVRGKVIYSQWRAGCIGEHLAKDDNCLEVGIAYTLWHRHDEPPEVVERELSRLIRTYQSFNGCDGLQFGYEYRDYRK